MNKEIIEKVSEMVKTLPKEQFRQAMFPTLKTKSVFEELNKFNQEKIATITSYPQGKDKFDSIREFILRLKDEYGFDPIYGKLYDDEYVTTRKIGSHKTSDYLVSKMDSDEHIEYEKLCDEYAKYYERVCKRYFQPFINIIYSQKKSCGKCIEDLKMFEPKLEHTLNPFISHIRNSINHSDYYPDVDKKGIIFDDGDKPPITKTEEDLKLLIRLMVESELAISAAQVSFKIPLHKTIIEDSDKTLQYCKILGIDYDEFMKEFISRGYSIFQLKLTLEKIVKTKK